MYEIIYRDLLRETGEVPKVTCRIGMAQFAVPQDALEETGRGLFSLRADRLEAVRGRVRDLVERAGENGVNVLVFPEMAIDLNHAELLHDLLDLAQTYGMVIVPGSYHDLDTRRNVCRVLGPTGILWEQEKHIPAIMRFGAHTIEEGIAPDPARRVTICNTPFGRMAVVICRDFLDLDLRVELKNFNPAVDIVLNPALTPVTADFEAAHFEARRSIYAYCFFCNVAEFGNSAINTPEKDRTKRVIPPGKEELLWKDVDLFSLRAERKKWEKLNAGRDGYIQSTRGRVTSQPSSNMALESAVPTSQIAPTGPTKDSKPISPVGTEPAAPPLTEKPSIAVLPFDNLSADPSQEFFADGLVEEILTSLSKISSITVIARHSTYTYKGKAVDVRNVARDLGVRYVVEGSVRQGGNRLRITAQLIDSTDGSHLWAEKYDRVVEDIFDIQDEITKEIVTALRVNLSNSEEALLLNRGTKNVEAWTHCVQAMEHFLKFNPADNAKTRELAEQATIFDADYALAWALLGLTYWYVARMAIDEDSASGMARSAELAEKALALDETNSWALGLGMLVQNLLGNIEQSLAIGKRLISLHPGSADSRAWYSYALFHSGLPQESISMAKDAMHLNPRHPFWYKHNLARALDAAGQPKDALKELDGILAHQPDYFQVVLLRTCILAMEGRKKEANEAMTDLRRINPNFRLAHLEGYFMMRDREYVTALTEALRKAGLPE